MVPLDETGSKPERDYEFTNRWFSNAKPVWKDFFSEIYTKSRS